MTISPLVLRAAQRDAHLAKKLLFQNAAMVFEALQNGKPSREQELEPRIAALEAKLAEKEREAEWRSYSPRPPPCHR